MAPYLSDYEDPSGPELVGMWLSLPLTFLLAVVAFVWATLVILKRRSI